MMRILILSFLLSSTAAAQGFGTPPVQSPLVPQATSLRQENFDGSPLYGAETITGAGIRFVCNNPNPYQVMLEVEIQPTGTEFTDVPLIQGTLANFGADSTIILGSPVPGNHYWQARFITATGATSGWVPFLYNSIYAPDFVVPTENGYTTNFDHSWGWTFSAPFQNVGWAVDGDGPKSNGQTLNYNNGTDYYTSGFAGPMVNSGISRSPYVDISTLESPELRFRCNYETDTSGTGTDQRWIRITSFDGIDILAVELELQLSTTSGGCSEMGSWHEHVISLEETTFHLVKVSFEFNTIDEIDNGHAGWFVDDFSIVADSGNVHSPGGTDPVDDDEHIDVAPCSASVGATRGGLAALFLLGLMALSFTLRFPGTRN